MKKSYLTLLSALVFAVAGTATAQTADRDIYDIEYHVTSVDGLIESGFGSWVPELPETSARSVTINGEKVNLKYNMSSGGDGFSMVFYITENDRMWGVFTSSQCGTAMISEQWTGKDFSIKQSFPKQCELSLSIAKP